VGGAFGAYLEAARDGWESLQRWSGFWGPVVGMPAALRPAALIGTVLAVVLMTGIALTSLALFVTTALFLYLLLNQFFGFEVSLSL
jgi:hypothetical protein